MSVIRQRRIVAAAEEIEGNHKVFDDIVVDLSLNPILEMLRGNCVVVILLVLPPLT